MAHYIAELIARAENANGDEKALADKLCFDAILTLWKHRTALPNGKRPYETLEPINRAIESLDPENTLPRYFRSARPPKNEGSEKSETDTWLDTAEGLDYSARMLVGYCLAEAARSAVDRSKEWVRLAESAGAEDGVSEIVIRYVSTSDDLGKGPSQDSKIRQKLQDRLRRLEAFTKFAQVFADELRTRIEALPPESEVGSDDDPEAHVLFSSAPPLK